jgi:hypothetical protein
LDGLADQEVDCIPHFAAVSLWRLHAAGRDVPQPVTCEVLQRCLTHLDLRVEVVPVVVRIWHPDRERPMAEYGSTASDVFEAEADGYFVLVLPDIARVVDAHLPELPAIVGSQLEDRFLQAPFGPKQRVNAFGVNRFDRIVEYRPAPVCHRDVWRAKRPKEGVIDTLAESLLAEVLDVLRWHDVWHHLRAGRWPRLTAMMRAVADARLAMAGAGGPVFVYPSGRTAGMGSILAIADASLADF